MINTKEILQMAKAAVRRDQGYPDRRLIHPHREWVIGIVLFSVLMLGGGVAAGLLFLHYQNIESTITTTEQQIPTYQAAAVEDVLALYADRTDVFNATQDATPVALETTEATTTATSSDATSTSTDVSIEGSESTSPPASSTATQVSEQ